MGSNPEKKLSESKQAAQLRLLNDLSTKLQSLIDSDNFYQEIVNLIQIRFHYYSIHIWSVDDDSSATLKAQSGAYDRHMKIGHILDDSSPSIIGTVIQTKKSYLSNDVSKDPNFNNLSFPVKSKAELCVPIMKDKDTVGSTPGISRRVQQILATINIESDSIGAFDEDDAATLEAVASQVAVAISNRKLFQQTKNFNQTLQNAVEEKTQELRKAHERILEQRKLLQKENKALKSLVNSGNRSMEIIGSGSAIKNILTMVDKIAPTTATVLIQGESGTGKELIARRLHFKSNRANNAYVVVNCGALQESLLESELFGHEKGSFTGAIATKVGLAETADGGTIFLDEIGEMSLGIQAKLLRFLQEGEFYRIGGKRPVRVNLRVISATNRDLELEVKENRFREDLFYRLNTISLRMPPLRKRAEDMTDLVNHFLKISRFGGQNQQIKKVDSRVMEVFKNYDWPGNIRELQNTIERLKILAENNEIKLEDLPFGIRMPKSKKEPAEFGVELSLYDVEKSHILRALSYHQGNKTKTAQNLGITIKTLYNKLHKYGILNERKQT